MNDSHEAGAVEVLVATPAELEAVQPGAEVQPSAAAAGSFLLGGELPVARLGFGALHTVGRGGWGDAADPQLIRELLRLVPELGINLIDTADAYGPHTSEHLLREVLHPYDTVVIATKGGQVRPSPNEWRPLGRPEYLKQAAQLSRRRLGVKSMCLLYTSPSPRDRSTARMPSSA